MDTVYVVVYNDLECGDVNVDVFAKKENALSQLKSVCESCEGETIYDKYIEKTYDLYGNLVYFAEKLGDDETFYECFLREEEVQ